MAVILSFDLNAMHLSLAWICLHTSKVFARENSGRSDPVVVCKVVLLKCAALDLTILLKMKEKEGKHVLFTQSEYA